LVTKGKATKMIGIRNTKRMITGVLAGMAALSTFWAEPQSAHADAGYFLTVPSAPQMMYQNGEHGTLGIYRDGCRR
jgi:hypothetical protein